MRIDGRGLERFYSDPPFSRKRVSTPAITESTESHNPTLRVRTDTQSTKSSTDDSRRLVVFSPDHGVHLDEETGKGGHGLDIPEDMEVRSFWGIYPPEG